MDLLRNYAERSDDDEREDDESESKSLQLKQKPSSTPPSSPDSSSSSPLRISLPSKTSAPKVDDTLLALTAADPDARNLHKPIDPVQHVVSFNPTHDQLWAPIYGPAHPYAKDGIAQGMRNHKLGFVENAAIHPFLFDEQYNTFHKYGYAADPSAPSGINYVGDLDALQKNDAVSVYNIPQHEQKKRRLEQKASKNEDEEEADVEASGPDAENPASEEWLKKNRKSPWSGKKEGLQAELTEEQKKYAEEYAEKKADAASTYARRTKVATTRVSCPAMSVSMGSKKKRSRKSERLVGKNEVEASCGENVPDIDGRERKIRESTPCSMTRGSETLETPGSTTKSTNSATTSRRKKNALHQDIPSAREVDEFFDGAEKEQQRIFIEKYNFDPVNDMPLPGRYEWVRLDL